ncbi:hypothetical protein ABZ540_35190 [Nocardia xishanensis]|uniref:hypothetical protein n=1 Tax=Nocardia xishanensis TaxID=238964 RepID=UPI0033FCA35B
MRVRIERAKAAVGERPSRARSASGMPILALQRAAGNRAVADHMTQLTVQRRAEKAEEASPTEEGGVVGGLGVIACDVLPDAAVVGLVRGYFAVRYSHASQALVQYLERGGVQWDFNAAEYFLANPRAKTRVASKIGGGHAVGAKGSLVDRTAENAVIRQVDYDSEDWRLALGNIDQVDWEIIAGPAADGSYRVRLTMIDPYEWHPDEDRGTQCLHRVMENKKKTGAANFVAVGKCDLQLQL